MKPQITIMFDYGSSCIWYGDGGKSADPKELGLSEDFQRCLRAWYVLSNQRDCEERPGTLEQEMYRWMGYRLHSTALREIGDLYCINLRL